MSLDTISSIQYQKDHKDKLTQKDYPYNITQTFNPKIDKGKLKNLVFMRSYCVTRSLHIQL